MLKEECVSLSNWKALGMADFGHIPNGLRTHMFFHGGSIHKQVFPHYWQKLQAAPDIKPIFSLSLQKTPPIVFIKSAVIEFQSPCWSFLSHLPTWHWAHALVGLAWCQPHSTCAERREKGVQRGTWNAAMRVWVNDCWVDTDILYIVCWGEKRERERERERNLGLRFEGF